MDNRTIDEVRRNEDRLINKIELLEKENQGLKKQLEINNDVFMTSVEESCGLYKENYELKKKIEEKNNKLNSVLDYIDSNIFIEQFENVGSENNVRKEIIKRITNDKEVE